MRTFWTVAILALAFTFGGCKAHLEQEMKSESEVHDASAAKDNSQAKVSEDTKTASVKNTGQVKTKGPVTENTRVTIKVRGTKDHPGKTVVIEKSRTEGEVKDTKFVKSLDQSSVVSKGKFDEQKDASATHDEKAKSASSLKKDSKPSIPLSMGCLGGSAGLIIIIVIAALVFPGVLPNLLSKAGTFIKGFWQKFKEE
jgi:hypothetical protein